LTTENSSNNDKIKLQFKPNPVSLSSDGRSLSTISIITNDTRSGTYALPIFANIIFPQFIKIIKLGEETNFSNPNQLL
jgi:hypothetical protein